MPALPPRPTLAREIVLSLVLKAAALALMAALLFPERAPPDAPAVGAAVAGRGMP